jgi:hypothetical protein
MISLPSLICQNLLPGHSLGYIFATFAFILSLQLQFQIQSAADEDFNFPQSCLA